MALPLSAVVIARSVSDVAIFFTHGVVARVMEIHEIENALRKSWSRDTSYCRGEWSDQNPARGQCVVSALVVQDVLGGELKRYKVLFNGGEEKHYVNVLPDGRVVDVTSDQYPPDIFFEESESNLHGFESVREKLLADGNTKRRYMLLRSRVIFL